MSAALYEKLGRKQEEIENRTLAYNTLLDRFAGVLDGSIDPSRVLVNLTDGSWMVAAPDESPPAPAIINGLPKCVIGKPSMVQVLAYSHCPHCKEAIQIPIPEQKEPPAEQAAA